MTNLVIWNLKPLKEVHPLTAKILFAALMIAEIYLIQGYQRHHLIPDSVGNNRPLFQRSGLNITGATNMTYLPVAEGIDLKNPNSSLHNNWDSVHKDYNELIEYKNL